MAQQRFERQLRAGVAAAQQGQFDRARELLEGVLRQDRNNQLGYNELAWIWMAASVQSQNQRRKCLQEVIKINPANRPAREAINNLVGVIGSSATIDFNQIAAAAKAKLPAATGERDAATGGLRAVGGGNQRVVLMGGIALVLGLLLVGSFVLPPLFAPDPTPTPLPTDTPTPAVDESGATFTPRPPTNTPDIPQIAGQVVTRPPETPLPTNTPQPTPTPLDTAIPTATLPPLTNITLNIVADNGILYRVSGDGTGLQQIIDNIVLADVRANRLVFTRTTTGEGEGAASIAQAFVTTLDNPDGAGQATRLAQGTIEALSVSPDGSRMVFASTEDGDSELYLLNLQTGVIQKLTDNTFADTDPSWSPDGSQILFTSDRASLGRNKIYTHNLSNSIQTMVVDTSGLARSPQYSPDGSQIAYSNETSTNVSSIVVASADGRRSRQLQFRDSPQLTAPVWSNDGRYVIFVANYSDRADEIIFIAPDTGQVQRIVLPEAPAIRAISAH